MKTVTLDQPSGRRSHRLPHSAPSIGGLVRRPEMGSFIGLIAVFAFFSFFGGANFMSASGAASWLNVAAELGIVALPVGLLMIAGHLDLSVGIGDTGELHDRRHRVRATTRRRSSSESLAALGLGLAVGFINGFLVIRTESALLCRDPGHAVRGGGPDARLLHHPGRQHQRRAEEPARSPSSCSESSSAASSR